MSEHGSIGLRFKREREKKNFSIEDVHSRIRVHPTVLQKLEADDLTDWPGGRTYARGFIRQYSDFLGLNTPEILADFDSLGISARSVELFVGLDRKANAHSRETARPSGPKPEKKQESAAPRSAITPAPQPDLVRHLPPAGAPASAGSHVAAKWAVALMALVVVGLAALQISRGVRTWAERRPLKPVASASRQSARTAKPAPQAATKVLPTTPPTDASHYLNSPQQKNYPKIRPQDRMVLEISVTTDVWMRVQADGKVVFEAILHRGETERWLADKIFDLKLGRPEGVRIAMNGFSVGQPGAGRVKDLHITRDGIEELK